MCETKRSMSGALGPHTGEPQFGFVRWNIGEHTMPRLVVAKKFACDFGQLFSAASLTLRFSLSVMSFDAG